MGFHLVQEDITEMDVEAIVNAANTDLLPGGGVCGAIFSSAGYDKLSKACEKIGHVDTGKAVLTPGFNLKAKYIIHTAGPMYIDGRHNEKELLESCYKEALKLAVENNITSLAFPLISAGIYGYPKEEAYDIALQTIKNFLDENEMEVYLTLLDKSFLDNRYKELKAYIQENQKEEERARRPIRDRLYSSYGDGAMGFLTLSEAIQHTGETFSEYLLHLIDEKGMTDPEVYKRAGIDRRLFSKIRKEKNYRPNKETVLRLCIGLKLNIDDAKDLLNKAGYGLSDAIQEDLAIKYYIEKKEYDIFVITEAFFDQGLRAL